jgi:hypothetical protein
MLIQGMSTGEDARAYNKLKGGCYHLTLIQRVWPE